jgi:hypothetical protein
MTEASGPYCAYLTTASALLSTQDTIIFGDEWFDTTGVMSHYKPNLPPKPDGSHPNCEKYNWETRHCDSETRSGEPWELWENCSLACPEGYMYTLWQLEGGEIFLCLDTGTKVVSRTSVTKPGTTAHWLDLLLDIQSNPPVVYGTELPVRFKFGTLVED